MIMGKKGTHEHELASRDGVNLAGSGNGLVAEDTKRDTTNNGKIVRM